MTKEQFKAIRRSLKYSQAKMAKHLGGYSVSTIRKWEYGINRVPKAVVALLRKK